MKKIFNYSLFLFLFSGITGNNLLNAQDGHFTQYNSSPLNLNPAQAGLFDGEWRLAGIYRNQWASVANVPFNTYSFSGDRRVITAKSRTYTPALGFLINSDKSGDSRLKSTQVYVSAGLIKKLNEDSTHFFSLGVQPGITNKNFDANSISFDKQFDGSKYNPGLSNGENIPSTSLTYFDVGVGGAYYWEKTPRNKLNIGVSAFHLNKPKQSFYDNDNVRLDVKYTMSGIAEMALSERVGILPSLLFQRQGAQKELMMGLFGKYYFTNIDQLTTALSLGAFVRAKDAYAVILSMDYQRFNVGVSYDINYSKLISATNNRGAFELSLVYIFKKTPLLIAKQRPCPLFM